MVTMMIMMKEIQNSILQQELECDDDLKGDYVILVTWDPFHVSWEIFALVIFNHDWCDQYRGSFKTLSNQRYPTSVTFLIRCRCIHVLTILKFRSVPTDFFLSQTSSATFIGKASVTPVFNVYNIAALKWLFNVTNTNWDIKAKILEHLSNMSGKIL